MNKSSIKTDIYNKISSYTLNVSKDIDNYYSPNNIDNPESKDEHILAEILSLNLKLIYLSQQLNPNNSSR